VEIFKLSEDVWVRYLWIEVNRCKLKPCKFVYLALHTTNLEPIYANFSGSTPICCKNSKSWRIICNSTIKFVVGSICLMNNSNLGTTLSNINPLSLNFLFVAGIPSHSLFQRLYKSISYPAWVPLEPRSITTRDSASSTTI
jgi:hypothetical protein